MSEDTKYIVSRAAIISGLLFPVYYWPLAWLLCDGDIDTKNFLGLMVICMSVPAAIGSLTLIIKVSWRYGVWEHWALQKLSMFLAVLAAGLLAVLLALVGPFR